MMLIFQNSVGNFEMVHKTSSILVSGAVYAYTAKFLFHQSPTRHSDYTVTYHCDNVVTVLKSPDTVTTEQ